MCEEACPVEAIELTGLYDLTGLSREQMIFDKAKLLSVFDLTVGAEPMKYTNPPAPSAAGRHRARPRPAPSKRPPAPRPTTRSIAPRSAE